MQNDNQMTLRSIEIFLKGSDEPLWVIKDSEVPLPNDQLSIEDSDGKFHVYIVEFRTWITAKQGDSSFSRVRLTVRESKLAAAAVFGTYGAHD